MTPAAIYTAAKLGGILAAVLACLAIGYHFGEMPYKAKYEALQAEDWKTKAQGEEAAKVVIAGQLVDLQKQIEVNSHARDTLAKQNESIVADRDATLTRVRRLEQLLVIAGRQPAAGSGAVSKDDSGSSTASPGGQDGPTEAERLLIAAKESFERLANDYDALVTEVTPQVTPE